MLPTSTSSSTPITSAPRRAQHAMGCGFEGQSGYSRLSSPQLTALLLEIAQEVPEEQHRQLISRPNNKHE